MMVSYLKWYPHPFVLLTYRVISWNLTMLPLQYQALFAAFTSALNVVFHRHCQNTVCSVVKVKHIGSRVSFMRGHLVPMNQEPH